MTHFLEHMLFKGTKKRPTAKKLAEIIDSIGGEWNAATGKESTAYYIKASVSNLKRAFEILSDMVINPLLSEREIEKEKNVIISEIAMYEDTPTRRVAEIFEELLYPDCALGWDIAGIPESVMNIKKSDFLTLRKQFYTPHNMVITVAGGIKEKDVTKLAERYLGSLNSGEARKTAQRERFLQKEPRALVRYKDTDQAHSVIGVRGNPRGHPDRWAEEILSSILGGGMSSRLWIAVRERRGLAYYVRSEIEHYQDNGYFAIYSGVDPKHAYKAIQVILSEIHSFKAGKGFTDRELKKGKEYVKGHLDLSLEDTRSVAGFMGSFELLEDRIFTPEEIKEKIDAVTQKDVVRVANEFFVPERLNLAVIGPYKDGGKFEKVLQFLNGSKEHPKPIF